MGKNRSPGLGQLGDRVIYDLFILCGIFAIVSGGFAGLAFLAERCERFWP